MPETVPLLFEPRPQVEEEPGGGDARVRAQIAVLEQALSDDLVTFHDVAAAWFLLCEDDVDPELRARVERLYPKLRAAFEQPRGGIITAYFCRHVRVAAALTDIRRAADLPEGLPKTEEPGRRYGSRASASSSAIHLEPLFGLPEDAKAKELLYRCLDLHYRALEFLTPKPRKICMRLLFSIIAGILGALDARAAGAPAHRTKPLDLSCMEGELARAESYYRRSAQRQAQLTYFGGLAAPAFAVAVAALLVAAIGGADGLQEPFTAAALAGAAGGVVSVLMRMSRGQLALNHEFGAATIRVLGVSRLLLGAMLGAALYVLLTGGIVPMPDGAQHNLSFFAGAAFLAGFTERLVADAGGGAPAAAGGQAP
jgi:hypothetical protein